MDRRSFLERTVGGASLTAFGPLSRLAIGRTAPASPVAVEYSIIPEVVRTVRHSVQCGRPILTGGPGGAIQLNAVGSLIWSSIDGRRSCQGIADILAREYGVDRSRAHSDTKVFVEELARSGFLDVTRHCPCFRLPQSGNPISAS